MPQNDPASWEAIAGYFAAAFSAVTLWAWRHTQSVLGKKAEASLVQQLIDRFDETSKENRSDAQRIYNEIREVTDAFHMHVEKVAEELGKRPTRDECRQIWHRVDT